MAKFKIGDRVKYIGDKYKDYLKKDSLGTVRGSGYNDIEKYRFICVEWDNKISGGHECENCKDDNNEYIRVKFGHGWNVSEKELKSLKPKSKYDKEMVIESSKRKFEVGDRVVGVAECDGNPDIINVKGTIKYINDSHDYKYQNIGVCWDETVYGHTLDDETCEDGHGWNVNPEHIKLLRPKGRFDKVMVVEDVISESQEKEICKVLKDYDMVTFDHTISEEEVKKYIKIIKDCGHIYYNDPQTGNKDGGYIYRYWKDTAKNDITVGLHIGKEQVEYSSFEYWMENYIIKKVINIKDVIKKARLLGNRFNREMTVENVINESLKDGICKVLKDYDIVTFDHTISDEVVRKYLPILMQCKEYGNSIAVLGYIFNYWEEQSKLNIGVDVHIKGKRIEYNPSDDDMWNMKKKINIKKLIMMAKLLDNRFNREMTIESLNESYDVETVKSKLPNVRITFDGKEYEGYIRSNETEFAYVRIEDFPGTKFKYSWETITDSLNNNFALET